MKPTQRLQEVGQSLWLDNIARGLLTDGTLRRYIAELSVTGLTLLTTLEFLADKVDLLDSVVHSAQFPLSLAAGAVVAGAAAGAIGRVDPGLTVVIALLVGGATSGAVHGFRTLVRPVSKAFLLPAAAVSLAEDAAALVLAGTSILAPVLAPLCGGVLLVVLYWLARRVARRIKGILGGR